MNYFWDNSCSQSAFHPESKLKGPKISLFRWFIHKSQVFVLDNGVNYISNCSRGLRGDISSTCGWVSSGKFRDQIMIENTLFPYRSSWGNRGAYCPPPLITVGGWGCSKYPWFPQDGFMRDTVWLKIKQMTSPPNAFWGNRAVFLQSFPSRTDEYRLFENGRAVRCTDFRRIRKQIARIYKLKFIFPKEYKVSHPLVFLLLLHSMST